MTQNAFDVLFRQSVMSADPPLTQRATSVQECRKDERISVCHVVAGSEWAGAEAQVATLARWLARNPDIALHAIVLYDRRLARELRSAGVDVYVASESNKSFPRLIAECSEFVKSRKIQILHSHCYKENIISLAVSWFSHMPRIVRSEHGIPERYSVIRNLKHWCVLAVDRLAARYTPARIIGVSSDLAGYWKKHANPKNVMVLRNGVDLERTTSPFTPAEAKQRIGISGECFVVGLAARLEPVKRLDLFISTAAYIAERVPNARFVVAGGGRLEPWLRQRVADAGLQSCVFVLGERSDVYDVLRAMDVLLLCSDHEGVPMVMLEAMALGVAVVSRKVGGIPEVIDHENTGILVPSGSPEDLGRACLDLFQEPELRDRLVQAARQEIRQKHSAAKNAESVFEVYRSICTGNTSE